MERHIEYSDNESPSPIDVARTLMLRSVAAIEMAQAENIRSERILSEAQERLGSSQLILSEQQRITEGLKRAIMALARSERSKHTPPERMVTLLKTLTVEAGIERLEPPDSRTLVDDVVRWGIDAYYAA